MKKIRYLLLSFMMILSFTVSFGQFRPGSFLSYTEDTLDIDVIEQLPKDHSYINWTKGQLVTKYQIPITYTDPNIGRNTANWIEKLTETIIQFAIGALGQLRVSTLFLMNDYLKNNQAMKLDILSRIYSLSLENNSINASFLSSQLTIPLYGDHGFTEFIYNNIIPLEVTNYLKPEETTSQFYDTLIIDMVMFPHYNPSLMPRILNQKGEVLYSVETISPAILKERGALRYVSSITEALKDNLRGQKVAYVLPQSIEGTLSSDIVLFNQDVERIFSQQRTINQLKQGKVIVIIPPKTNL